RLVDPTAERLRSVAREQVVGVAAGRQQGRAHAQALWQQHFERALHRPLTCLVAVEQENDVARAPAEVSRVTLGQRGPAGGDCLLDAGARERDAVEIAFHHYRAIRAPDRRQRRGQPVERLALVEDRALRSVQILRLLSVIQRATAEADDAAARVV